LERGTYKEGFKHPETEVAKEKFCFGDGQGCAKRAIKKGGKQTEEERKRKHVKLTHKSEEGGLTEKGEACAGSGTPFGGNSEQGPRFLRIVNLILWLPETQGEGF